MLAHSSRFQVIMAGESRGQKLVGIVYNPSTPRKQKQQMHAVALLSFCFAASKNPAPVTVASATVEGSSHLCHPQ